MPEEWRSFYVFYAKMQEETFSSEDAFKKREGLKELQLFFFLMQIGSPKNSVTGLKCFSQI